MNIVVITQYFHPEQFRVNDMCVEWVKRGHSVIVITGIPNYPKGKFYDGYGLFRHRKETFQGVEIVRLPIVPRGKHAIQLAMNYLSFVISGFFWFLNEQRKADLVFIYEVSPMSQALPGVWFARKNKIPCLLYVTDLWPESVEFAGNVHNRTVLSQIGKMVDYIYARCDRIFTSSMGFIDAIEKRGVDPNKLSYWPSYADGVCNSRNDICASAPEVPKDDQFNIIFAGNIGFAQGLDVLPKAAALLKQRQLRVRFVIVGDGRYKNQLVNKVHEYDLMDMFLFIGKQPLSRVPEFLHSCDAALISLAKSQIFSLTIPAKTQSYFACGIPIIVSADGEVQRIVESACAGVTAEAENPKMLCEKISEMMAMTHEQRKQMGRNAYEYSQQHFNKKKLFDIMDMEFTLAAAKGLQTQRHKRTRSGMA